MDVYTEWTPGSSPIPIPKGVSVKWYYDCEYMTEGSYALDTEEETREAEAEEIAKLESGEWVVLGYVVETDDGEHIDSLWGIVIEPDEAKMAEMFGFHTEIPSGVEIAKGRLERAKAAVEKAREAWIQAVIDAELEARGEAAKAELATAEPSLREKFERVLECWTRAARERN